MSLNLRTLGLVAVGAAVVLGLAYTSLRTDPVPVDLATITRGPMQVTIDADGKTPHLATFSRWRHHSAERPCARPSQSAIGSSLGKPSSQLSSPIASGLLDSRSRLQAQAAVHEAEAALNVAQTELLKAQDDAAYARNQHERTKTLVDRAVASFTPA